MFVHELFQLVLKNTRGEGVEDGVQGTVYWKEKYHYPGSDRAWKGNKM